MNRRILTTLTLGTMLAAQGAMADEIHVPADFPTIQIAINVSLDGDEIIVAPDSVHGGPYFEALNFLGKAITVRSSAGSMATTINAAGQITPAVTMNTSEGPGSVLSGFKITGGSSVVSGNDRGAGVVIWGASPRIEDCVFTANEAIAGGALYATSSQAQISRCKFVENSAPAGNGGAIYVNASNGFALIDCVMQDNWSAGHGGAVRTHNSNLLFERCTFRGNAAGATAWGGGLYSVGGTPIVRNSVFHDNFAGNTGAAIGVAGSCRPLLVHVTATENTCGNDVVFYTASGGHSTIQNSIVWEEGRIPFGGAGTESVVYSAVSGGWVGTGNISLNPRFVNLSRRNLHLNPSSPCIDAGNSNLVIAAYPVDRDGNPRARDDSQTEDTGEAVFGLTVDMGAFESQGFERFNAR